MIRPLIIIGLLMANALWLALGYEPNTFAMLWFGYALGILFMRAPNPAMPRNPAKMKPQS